MRVLWLHLNDLLVKSAPHFRPSTSDQLDRSPKEWSRCMPPLSPRQALGVELVTVIQPLTACCLHSQITNDCHPRERDTSWCHFRFRWIRSVPTLGPKANDWRLLRLRGRRKELACVTSVSNGGDSCLSVPPLLCFSACWLRSKCSGVLSVPPHTHTPPFQLLEAERLTSQLTERLIVRLIARLTDLAAGDGWKLLTFQLTDTVSGQCQRQGNRSSSPPRPQWLHSFPSCGQQTLLT